MRERVKKNVAASILLSFVNLINVVVVPRIILSCFGSETNGLINSIVQFLNYIQLLEGGLTSVIMAALYKPLSLGDEKKVYSVVKTAESFFRKIAIIYVLYTVAVAFIYPLFVETPYDYSYVTVLVFVIAIGIFVQYFFSLSYRVLLNADQRSYVVSLTQVVFVLVNLAIVIITTRFWPDIIAVKLFSAAGFFVQPIIYRIYIKKEYNFDVLDYSVEADNNLISQRWDGFGQNMAYFIHTNTDIIILTLLSTLKDISVYSVYFMVVNSLKMLVMTISQAISPSFGRVLAEGDASKTDRVFGRYDFTINYISTLLFVSGILLVTPFVHVYTSGIDDANYYQPVFGLILGIAEWIYCLRDPYVSAAYAAGHFKQTAKYAYTEAALNIVISIILVPKLGIIGVAIGTLVSMAYRMIMHALYLKWNILHRKMYCFAKKMIVFGSCFVISGLTVVALGHLRHLEIDNYFQWVEVGVIVFVIVLGVTTLLSIKFYKEEFSYVIGRKK